MRIVLLGPPGAGKGTQAARLAKRTGAKLIATGDIFRKNVRGGTELGRTAKQYMDRGDLVPDGVVVAMVADELEGVENGFILDGFPRTIAQAEALEKELSDNDQPLTAALAFLIDDEEVVRRLSGRRVCTNCGRNYHVDFSPPRGEGVCDVCGGELALREDDEEQVVRRRLEVYEESTTPLLDFYRGRGLLREVPAKGTEDEVTERALAALEEAEPAEAAHGVRVATDGMAT